jgi:hypothetical protein
MRSRIIHRNDSAAAWLSADPILGRGEFGVENDVVPYKFKIGDGISKWSELPYHGTGTGGGLTGYLYIQSSPSVTWTINHNLGYRPQVELRDTGNRVYEADVEHPNVNQTIVTHVAAFAGTAWLL